MKLSPNVGSDRSWVWNVAGDASEGSDGSVETLAIRFGNSESESRGVSDSERRAGCSDWALRGSRSEAGQLAQQILRLRAKADHYAVADVIAPTPVKINADDQMRTSSRKLSKRLNLLMLPSLDQPLPSPSQPPPPLPSQSTYVHTAR